MIEMACIEVIRHLYFQQGWKVRRIARELHVSRQTVRKAIRSAEVPTYHLTAPRPKPVLGPYIEHIDRLLKEREKQPRKQRYTAHRIFELLRDEYGYSGCESIVRAYVRQKKLEVRDVFLPLEFEAGKHAQCDWLTVVVVLGGKRVSVECFALRLCFSRASFVAVYPSQCQEAFFDGHKKAFLFFEGVPHTVVYDNLKTAVRKVLTGRNRLEQERFISFRSSFGYAASFCNVAKANEKGQVESLAGFVERNFFSPLPEADSIEELNGYLRRRCEEYLDREHPELPGVSIREALERERGLLLPLPRHDVECCRITTASVSTRSLFRFEGNSYSVPCRYANGEVTVKAFVDRVAAFRKDKQVASWPRCYEKGHKFVDFDHYLEVLVRKPGAVPFVSGFKDLCPLYHELYTAVSKMESGNKLFVRILLLAREYPREMVDRAIEKALRSGNVSYEYIVATLRRTSLPMGRPHDPGQALPGKLLEFRVRPANVSQFNMLIGEGREDV